MKVYVRGQIGGWDGNLHVDSFINLIMNYLLVVPHSVAFVADSCKKKKIKTFNSLSANHFGGQQQGLKPTAVFPWVRYVDHMGRLSSLIGEKIEMRGFCFTEICERAEKYS